LNIDLNINNERQDCKIGADDGRELVGEVNERHLGEVIWLIDFIYLYKMEQRNPLQLL
jgi:hypothetical protein